MTRKQQRKGKKNLRFRQILGAGFLLGGFGVLLVASVLQNDGAEVNMLWFLIAFLACMAISVVLELSTLKGEILLEIETRQEKYRKQPLTQLANLNQERINRTFQALGFQKKDMMWYKKQFSWVKGGGIIRYYARCVSEGEDMNWLQMFDDPKLASKNLCIFAFLCREKVTTEDEEDLRMRATNFILMETLIAKHSGIQTLIPILLDESTGSGEFLELSQRMSIYAHGCKLLKQYFSEHHSNTVSAVGRRQSSGA